MNSYLYFIAVVLIFFLGIPVIRFIYRFFRAPKKGETKYFQDSHGRICIFRGANVCNASKTTEDMLPWHTEKEYKLFKEYGFNVIRFLVFWEAIEPEKGKYNEDYILKVRNHIRLLNTLGINVIVDIHQDLFNKKFTGNGFPNWALPEGDYKFTPQKDWFMNYFQEAVIKSYKNFWKSKALQQKYVDMVVYVHEHVKDFSNVLGIDVMNEPFPTLPFIFMFEKNALSDLYHSIQLELAGKSNRLPIFFEPAIQTSAGIPSYVHCWGAKRYIPHYYPPFCHNKGVYRAIDSLLMAVGIRAKAREAQLYSSPFIVGEFGVGKDVKNRFNAIHDFLNISDKYGMSWTWYTYDKEEHSTQGMLDDYGNPNAIMNLLSRPFPHYIAGTNPVFYNEVDKFYLEYDNTDDIKAPTEIYIPGVVVDVKTNTTFVTDDSNRSVVKFYNKEPGKQTIRITWQSS